MMAQRDDEESELCMDRDPTVLVADDDRTMVQAITTRLESDGYRVIPAYDSYQALQTTRREHPDVLLSDVNMPAGDGIELLESIERLIQDTDMHLVYLTGERSQRVRQAAHQHGAFAVVYKPFNSRTLVETIERALQSSRCVPMDAR